MFSKWLFGQLHKNKKKHNLHYTEVGFILSFFFDFLLITHYCFNKNTSRLYVKFWSELLFFQLLDIEQRKIIDKLANFVARNGPKFEELTKSKQRGNAKFSFLFGGDFHEYYKWKVNLEGLNLKFWTPLSSKKFHYLFSFYLFSTLTSIFLNS